MATQLQNNAIWTDHQQSGSAGSAGGVKIIGHNALILRVYNKSIMVTYYQYAAFSSSQH